MPGKFKLIILFILIQLISLYYATSINKNITILKSEEENISKNSKNISNYLISKVESSLINNKSFILYSLIDLIEKEINANISDFYLKKITNFLFSKKINAFYFIKIYEENDLLILDLKLYNSLGNILYEYNFKLEEIMNNDKISLDKEKEWTLIIDKSIDELLKIKNVNINLGLTSKEKFKFYHDFPVVNLGISLISSKLYFDSRVYDYFQKLFAIAPMDLRFSFYPLRYFELGLFCQFDFNNSIFKYYKNSKAYFFESYFNLNYGLFFGLSFFYESFHYSLGVQAYNIYYDISLISDWQRKNTFSSYFIPQFSFYQKLDFKVFKVLYFTILVNFKTTPMFNIENDYFYSKTFYYDFFVVEVNFIGISFIF